MLFQQFYFSEPLGASDSTAADVRMPGPKLRRSLESNKFTLFAAESEGFWSLGFTA